jgi:FlaA1/EpsC-like NDP-sugar epimerase/lipopolysaccharide/colanic/teichoic acid biosynthesis glycosyltransferase
MTSPKQNTRPTIPRSFWTQEADTTRGIAAWIAAARRVAEGTLKRTFDITMAALGLVLLSPVILVVAFAVKRGDGGPVFYRALRVGRGGRPFILYKFRTMRVGADREGPGITAIGDSRITPIGSVLRGTKLDELPQLINVLRGEMSLVGPRPEDPRYVALYSTAQRRVLDERPGMTSAASLGYHREQHILAGPLWEEAYVQEVMPAKLAIDLQYLARRTIWSDIGLIVRTIAAMFGLAEWVREPAHSLILAIRNRHFFAADLVISMLAPAIALTLRTDGEGIFDQHAPSLAVVTGFFMLINLAVFLWGGLYNKYWRYAGVEELAIIGGLGVIAVALHAGVFFWVLRPTGWVASDFPRSLPLIYDLIVLVLVGAVRYSVRLADGLRLGPVYSAGSKRTLVVGAGQTGVRIVDELKNSPQFLMLPVAFVDDTPSKANASIRGLPVLGRCDDIVRVAREMHARHVVIAMPQAPGKTIRRIIELCDGAGLVARIVPAAGDLFGGKVTIKQLREVRIEDLLRREPVQTDLAAVGEMLMGKRVLVTGGGGSIGSEICRQVLRFEPRTLVILGHGENSVFEIHNELTALLQKMRSDKAACVEGAPGALIAAGKGDTDVRLAIADIRHAAHISSIFEEQSPEIVFHAAAHKHVHLMEMNPREAITNNILGTRNVLDSCLATGVERFVMISTDKAVNPTGIMGATKRVAEMLMHQAVVLGERNYVAVRFGNVLGSRGSAVPIFQQQIAAGGPVTVTHPDMKRYFMTIRESVQLVLQSATLGRGGEVFMLDMGEPLRILDLARDLIRLSGIEEGRDIDIVFTGIRPGEKMVEELHLDEETYTRTRHDKIRALSNPAEFVPATLDAQVRSLQAAVIRNDRNAIYSELCALVPEFRPRNIQALYEAPPSQPEAVAAAALPGATSWRTGHSAGGYRERKGRANDTQNGKHYGRRGAPTLAPVYGEVQEGAATFAK